MHKRQDQFNTNGFRTTGHIGVREPRQTFESGIRSVCLVLVTALPYDTPSLRWLYMENARRRKSAWTEGEKTHAQLTQSKKLTSSSKLGRSVPSYQSCVAGLLIAELVHVLIRVEMRMGLQSQCCLTLKLPKKYLRSFSKSSRCCVDR